MKMHGTTIKIKRDSFQNLRFLIAFHVSFSYRMLFFLKIPFNIIRHLRLGLTNYLFFLFLVVV